MICLLVNACFLLFLQHPKNAGSEKASTNFRLNESQKVFLLPAQSVITLYSLRIVACLLVNARKTTQALLFLIRTEFSFFYDLKFILFRLFLILCFVAETGVVPNL